MSEVYSYSIPLEEQVILDIRYLIFDWLFAEIFSRKTVPLQA